MHWLRPKNRNYSKTSLVLLTVIIPGQLIVDAGILSYLVSNTVDSMGGAFVSIDVD